MNVKNTYNPHHELRCQQRMPDVVSNGWTVSPLCDLPKGHEGPCDSGTKVKILTEKVIPEIEKKQTHKQIN